MPQQPTTPNDLPPYGIKPETYGVEQTQDAEVVFIARMRREREKRQWSQAKLAEMVARAGVDMHPTAITKLEWATSEDERPARNLRLNEALAIANVLRLTLKEMLSDNDVTTSEQELVKAQKYLDELLQHREVLQDRTAYNAHQLASVQDRIQHLTRMAHTRQKFEGGVKWAKMNADEREDAMRQIAAGEGDPDLEATRLGRITKGIAKVIGPPPPKKADSESDD